MKGKPYVCVVCGAQAYDADWYDEKTHAYNQVCPACRQTKSIVPRPLPTPPAPRNENGWDEPVFTWSWPGVFILIALSILLAAVMWNMLH